MERWVVGMRDAFSEALYELAKKDPQVVLVTSDTGAICHDKIRYELSNQYINVGIAEQNMIGIGAGLAMAGKKPFVYAIASFASGRCYEQTRVDLCCIGLPVTVVGVGAGFDYNTLGPTHHASEDIAIMRALPGMTVLSPSDSWMAQQMVPYCVERPGPKYIRLDRTGVPLVYEGAGKPDLHQGFAVLREGRDLCIVATGRMVPRACEVAEELARHSVEAAVVDMFRIKPIEERRFVEATSDYDLIVTLEEHSVIGGLGSAVLELFSNQGLSRRVVRFGIPDKFCRTYGDREYLRKVNGLDTASLAKGILQKLSPPAGEEYVITRETES
jgi:transketolase